MSRRTSATTPTSGWSTSAGGRFTSRDGAVSNSDSSQRRHAAGRCGNRGRRLRRSGPGRGQVRHPRCRRGTSRRQLTAVEPIGGIRAIEPLAERLRQAPEPPTPYNGPGRVERQGRPPGVLRDGPVRPRKFGHVGAVSTVARIEPSAVGSATVAMSAGIQSAVSQDGLAGNEAGAICSGCRKDGALVSAPGDPTNRPGHDLHLGIVKHSRRRQCSPASGSAISLPQTHSQPWKAR